jgi:proliferating cell nuclear antigen
VDEAYFEAGPDGLTLKSMDPLQIAFIDINWSKTNFEKYECPSTVKFGLRIDGFAKFIENSNVTENAEVYIKDKHLNIKTNGPYIRDYKMEMIDTNWISHPIPQVRFNNKIVIGTVVLAQILNDIQRIADDLSIGTNDKKGAIFMGHSDRGHVTITIEKKSKSGDQHEVAITENNKSMYNIDYLSKIVKAIGSASENVTLEYSSKKPLRLEFVISNSLKVQFYLAPRIEN